MRCAGAAGLPLVLKLLAVLLQLQLAAGIENVAMAEEAVRNLVRLAIPLQVRMLLTEAVEQNLEIGMRVVIAHDVHDRGLGMLASELD